MAAHNGEKQADKKEWPIGHYDKFSCTPRKQIHARRAFEKGMQVKQVSKDGRKPEIKETDDEMTAGVLGGTVKNVWDLLTSGTSDGMLLHPDSMRQMKVKSPPLLHKFAKQCYRALILNVN